MRKIRIPFLAASVCLLVLGCATKPADPISLNNDFFKSEPQEKEIGIYVSKIPENNVSFPGAGCLLCLGVAMSTNDDLIKHTKTLEAASLDDTIKRIQKNLEKRNIKSQVIADDLIIRDLPKLKSELPNSTNNDFTTIKTKYGITHLLVIQIDQIGYERTYSNYVPTADPAAIFRGIVYLVNLDNNTYELYMPVKEVKRTDDNWKEPPSFPGLTNAYFQALESGKAFILDSMEESKTPATDEVASSETLK